MYDSGFGKKSGEHGFTYFYEPKSIAVIGTFQQKGIFGGYVMTKTLLNAGYTGPIYPINPNPEYEEVLGLKVHSRIGDIEAGIDLAFIMVNARNVPPIMRECGEKGVRAVVLVSDGFAERNREGADLQREVLRIAGKYGIRVVGPNTAGIASSKNGVNPCPYEAGYYRLKKGAVAICAQTGMINPQAYPYDDLGLGVNKICDLGNKSDLDECDLLEYLEGDETTRVVSLYLESIQDGRRFLEVAKRVTARKPVLVFKTGRTEEGARASSSHTGSMAVDFHIFDAACRQAGILTLDEFDDIFDMPRIFTHQPLPTGKKLGIVSFTGGVGVLAADRAKQYGLEIASLTSGTAKVFEDFFPGLGTMPVDIGPMLATLKNLFEIYPEVLRATVADENVDMLFNVIFADATMAYEQVYYQAYEGIKGCFQKPVATWIYGPGTHQTSELALRIEDLGFPVFRTPEKAIKALGLTAMYAMGR